MGEQLFDFCLILGIAFKYGTDYLYEKMLAHLEYRGTKKGNPVSWALRADIDTERNAEKVGMPREIVVYDSGITNIITT